MDLWPFDLLVVMVVAAAAAVEAMSVVDIGVGVGGGVDGELATGLSLFATCGCWLVSVSVRLQHGCSFAASIAADIVNWA